MIWVYLQVYVSVGNSLDNSNHYNNDHYILIQLVLSQRDF